MRVLLRLSPHQPEAKEDNRASGERGWRHPSMHEASVATSFTSGIATRDRESLPTRSRSTPLLPVPHQSQCSNYGTINTREHA